MEEKVTVSKKVWISLLSIMLTLATFSACWWLHKMFFLILVCTFYSTKKLIGEVIGNIKFEDEKAD